MSSVQRLPRVRRSNAVPRIQILQGGVHKGCVESRSMDQVDAKTGFGLLLEYQLLYMAIRLHSTAYRLKKSKVKSANVCCKLVVLSPTVSIQSSLLVALKVAIHVHPGSRNAVDGAQTNGKASYRASGGKLGSKGLLSAQGNDRVQPGPRGSQTCAARLVT